MRLCIIENFMLSSRLKIMHTKMKKSIENRGKTATNALKNEVAGKAQMPEVWRRMVTRAA
jgi:hypothetical protein